MYVYVCMCIYLSLSLYTYIYIYIYIYALGIVDRARGMRGVSCLLQQSHVIVIVRIKEVCCQIVNRARGVQRRISTSLSLSLYIYIYIYVYACIHTHTYMYLTSRVSQSGAMPACALRREAGVTYISLSILYIIMYIYIYVYITVLRNIYTYYSTVYYIVHSIWHFITAHLDVRCCALLSVQGFQGYGLSIIRIRYIPCSSKVCLFLFSCLAILRIEGCLSSTL